MLNTKSFLAVDFGAGSLKLAEFEINEAGGLRLKQYGLRSLGAEGAQETTREATIQKAVQELIAERGIKSRTVNVCAPGFHVFSKFVKLPPVDAGKVDQIVEYEAKSNVPFPLEEVVWDYQILGATTGGELEVLLVAIKADIVEGLFRITESAGLHLQLTDVSPAALCNAFRYNYGDLDDCSMLLDIGAKTSNLLFFEKGKVFSRSINLGANSITQDFANESKKKFDVAEKIKIDEGFVSLGGAYEEPENQDQAAISKIARQFMTRLHIQVNQTMQFYRGQQGGSAPARLFLSGGASIMPYTAQFFAEKLNVPVEYFNPLRNVQIDPAINLEELARVAHTLGEVVGLGLRNLAHCPVELNLMPESTLKWQTFNQKKPYFIATIFSLVAVVAAVGLLFKQLAKTNQEALAELDGQIRPLKQNSEKLKKALTALSKAKQDATNVTLNLDQRFYWADVMVEMRNILMKVETGMKKRYQTDTGIWVERFLTTQRADDATSAAAGVTPYAPAAPAAPVSVGSSGGEVARPIPANETAQERAARIAAYRRAAGGGGGSTPVPAASTPGASTPPPPQRDTPTDATATEKKPKGGTNEIATISITFRAIGLNAVQPDADKEIVYSILNEIKSSPLFDSDPEPGQIQPEDAATGTFSFPVTVGLKRPFKL
jgi:type IV pilus assembly protein PilM